MRVPVYSRQQGVSVPAGGRLDIRAIAAPGEALARGSAQVTDIAFDYAEKLQKAQRAIELTTNTTAATREMDDKMLAHELAADWRDGPKRFDEDMKAIRDRYGERIQDPAVRAQFQGHFDNAVETRRVAFRRKMVDAMQKDGEAALLETLDVQSRAAAAAPNDLARDTAAAAAAKSIAEFRDAALIDPVKAVTLFRKFKGDVDEARVRALITADPDAALVALGDSARFPGLPPERRAILADSAARRADTVARQAIAAAEKADRDAAKNLKAAQDRHAADLWERLFKGTLTLEHLVNAKRTIDQGDFTALGNALRGQDGRDDASTVADLETRLASEDVTRDAVEALKSGRLKTATFQGLMARNRAALKDDSPASPYRSGRELVNVTLRPPEVLGAGAAQDAARAAQAQALVEYDNWFAANPQAPRGAAIDEAQGIIRRYQVIAFERMAIGVGLPRHHRGGRGDVTPEALDQAERETLRQLDARELSAEQAAQELRKIEAWREILARRPAAAPKATPVKK